MTKTNIFSTIQEGVANAVKSLYESDFPAEKVTISATRKEFEGDYTVVVFPFSKAARKKPEAIGEDLGTYLKENLEEVTDFNVIKGFLNLVISDDYWKNFLQVNSSNADYGKHSSNGKKVMVNILRLTPISLCTWDISEIFCSVGLLLKCMKRLVMRS